MLDHLKANNRAWAAGKTTADPDFFNQPELLSVSHQPKSKPGLKVWTDDYSALLPLIRW